VAAAAASQARHLLFHRAGGDAEQVGDALALLRRTHRAFGGDGVAAHHLLGEVATAGLAAGTAIRLGQQVFDLADARVFEDVELLVGDGEQQREQHAQRGHEATCHREIRQRLQTARSLRHAVLFKLQQNRNMNMVFVAPILLVANAQRQNADHRSRANHEAPAPALRADTVASITSQPGVIPRLQGGAGALAPARACDKARVSTRSRVTGQL
jgi:hypothetical protein